MTTVISVLYYVVAQSKSFVAANRFVVWAIRNVNHPIESRDIFCLGAHLVRAMIITLLEYLIVVSLPLGNLYDYTHLYLVMMTYICAY